MTNSIPEIPEDHFLGLGKVVVAAAKLDLYLALAVMAITGVPDGGDWVPLASKPGKAMTMLDDATAHLPDDHEHRRLWADARGLLDQRNRFIHAHVVYMRDPDNDDEPGLRLHHPRGDEYGDMPSYQDLLDLAQRLILLTNQAVSIAGSAGDAPAASVRPEDTP